MSWLTWVVILYGILNIVAGFLGYQAGSEISLYAGGGLGLLVLIAGVLSIKTRIGFPMAAILAAAGAANFFMRYFKTHTVWPGLVMGIISVFVALLLVAGHIAKARKKRTLIVN